MQSHLPSRRSVPAQASQPPAPPTPCGILDIVFQAFCCAVAEISQIHTTTEISFIATNAQRAITPTSQNVLNMDPFIHMGKKSEAIYTRANLGCLGHSQVEKRRGSTIGSVL